MMGMNEKGRKEGERKSGEKKRNYVEHTDGEKGKWKSNGRAK